MSSKLVERRHGDPKSETVTHLWGSQDEVQKLSSDPNIS